MTETIKVLKDFFENTGLYIPVKIKIAESIYFSRAVDLKEIQGSCEICEESKPFHNLRSNNNVVFFSSYESVSNYLLEFQCVTCKTALKSFWIEAEQDDEQVVTLIKIGQNPQKEIFRNKELSKFFKSDKDEYNKAVTCIAHGYGVAAFAYMRRIIENNIMQLLDMIAEDDMVDNSIKSALSELRKESPMSEKISIANKALPSYLLISGHNPLGAMYKVLSEGVHSLSDEECLRRTETVQKCLEYIISGLATHKKSKEAFKNNLDLLKSF